MYLLLLSLVLFSCTKEEEHGLTSAYFNSNLSLQVVNNAGEDLLDSSTPNSIDVNAISLTFVIDGKEVNYYKSNLDNPKGIGLKEYSNGLNKLTVLLNYEYSNANNITYINWGDGTRDKIESFLYNKSSTYDVRRIWVNDEFFWEFPEEIKIKRIVK